jgi:Nickel responsive protein SCO4226-like
MADDPSGIVNAMPTYLVERYLPGRDREWLEAALARIPRQRDGVKYLGSTYVPSDDSCFSRFEAETADDVRDANEVAGVPFARIVAATELRVGRQTPSNEGGSS